MYFIEKDFHQPTSILYENTKTNDSEYMTDNDKIPPLEHIPDYDSDDDSIPLLEHISSYASDAQELLATDTAALDVTPILKQDINYCLELIIAISHNSQGCQFIFLCVLLIDSGSNKLHTKYNKIPKWIRDQATPTADQAPFIR